MNSGRGRGTRRTRRLRTNRKVPRKPRRRRIVTAADAAASPHAGRRKRARRGKEHRRKGHRRKGHRKKGHRKKGRRQSKQVVQWTRRRRLSAKLRPNPSARHEFPANLIARGGAAVGRRIEQALRIRVPVAKTGLGRKRLARAHHNQNPMRAGAGGTALPGIGDRGGQGPNQAARDIVDRRIIATKT